MINCTSKMWWFDIDNLEFWHIGLEALNMFHVCILLRLKLYKIRLRLRLRLKLR